jgi:hypothetical protein
MVLTREQIEDLQQDADFQMACGLEIAGKKQIRVKDLYDTILALMAPTDMPAVPECPLCHRTDDIRPRGKDKKNLLWECLSCARTFYESKDT